MRALFAALLFASPGSAQELIDYNLLLEQHTDRVVTTVDDKGDAVRTLDMGDGIVVTCTSDSCVGLDEQGPEVGCIWSLLVGLRAAIEICSLPETSETKGVMSSYERVTAFVAENAVPPRSTDEMETLYRQAFDEWRREADGHPLDCKRETEPGSEMMMAINAFSEGSIDRSGASNVTEFAFDLDALLAKPRLPVADRCFY
jgi:hypothetical protein